MYYYVARSTSSQYYYVVRSSTPVAAPLATQVGTSYSLFLQSDDTYRSVAYCYSLASYQAYQQYQPSTQLGTQLGRTLRTSMYCSNFVRTCMYLGTCHVSFRFRGGARMVFLRPSQRPRYYVLSSYVVSSLPVLLVSPRSSSQYCTLRSTTQKTTSTSTYLRQQLHVPGTYLATCRFRYSTKSTSKGRRYEQQKSTYVQLGIPIQFIVPTSLSLSLWGYMQSYMQLRQLLPVLQYCSQLASQLLLPLLELLRRQQVRVVLSQEVQHQYVHFSTPYYYVARLHVARPRLRTCSSQLGLQLLARACKIRASCLVSLTGSLSPDVQATQLLRTSSTQQARQLLVTSSR